MRWLFYEEKRGNKNKRVSKTKQKNGYLVLLTLTKLVESFFYMAFLKELLSRHFSKFCQVRLEATS